MTQLILDDHHEQRRLFAILEQIDRADTGALAAIWGRLAAFLEVHAQAEEEIFYPELLRAGQQAGRLGTAEEETLDAIGDHNDIRDTIAAVTGHDVGSDDWYEAVAAVNVANGDHMAEEEREGLTDFRREASLQRRHELAVAFAAFEARHYTGVEPVDKDPAAYVKAAESPAVAAPTDESARADQPGPAGQSEQSGQSGQQQKSAGRAGRPGTGGRPPEQTHDDGLPPVPPGSPGSPGGDGAPPEQTHDALPPGSLGIGSLRNAPH